MLKAKCVVALTVLVVLVSLLVPPQAAMAKPIEFSVAYVTAVGQLTPLIYVLKGVLKNYGKSYTVNSLHFRGSSPQITALAAGQLEIANLAFSSFSNAVLNARLPVKIISDTLQDGVEGHSAQTWYVREDSPIRTMNDLKGKSVAVNVFGAATHLMLRVALKKNNLAPGKDVNIVEVKFPNMGPMLQGRKIDAGVIPVSLYFRDIRKVKLR